MRWICDSGLDMSGPSARKCKGRISAFWRAAFRAGYPVGVNGVHQHCGKKHLHRYAAEFAFRYSNRVANGPDDVIRANLALNGVVGKRVLYRDSLGA